MGRPIVAGQGGAWARPAARSAFAPIENPRSTTSTSARLWRPPLQPGEWCTAPGPPALRAVLHRSTSCGTPTPCARTARRARRRPVPARPPRARCQGVVHRRLDQRPPPQRDGLRPLPPGGGVPVCCRLALPRWNRRERDLPRPWPARPAVRKRKRRPGRPGSCCPPAAAARAPAACRRPGGRRPGVQLRVEDVDITAQAGARDLRAPARRRPARRIRESESRSRAAPEKDDEECPAARRPRTLPAGRFGRRPTTAGLVHRRRRDTRRRGR